MDNTSHGNLCCSSSVRKGYVRCLVYDLWLVDQDHLVPLNQFNVPLQLFHLCLHPLLPGFLGSRVCHHTQSLVLVVQYLPVLLETS